MQIRFSQLPCTPEEFYAGYEAYRAARDEHKLTVDIPAPWPKYELYRTMYEADDHRLEVLDDRPSKIVVASKIPENLLKP